MAILQPLHLYIHWPWCAQKCPYCDFNSHAIPSGGLSPLVRESYIRQVIEDIAWWANAIPPNRPLKSVFFGGGTPSLMTPQEVGFLIEKAYCLGKIDANTEVTLECNPQSLEEIVSLDYFKDLASAGVNRLSIGVQGLRPDWLAFLGRKHSVKNALETLDASQRVFKRVNADVIYGLPNQALPEWEDFLQTLAQRNLSHISAYQLTIERNTAFWGQVKRGDWAPLDGDTEASFFDATRQILRGAGYENYEISNFAKPGEACRHNLGVWRGEDYIGVGAGAHGRVTLVDGTRLATATRKAPEAYMEASVGEGKSRFVTYESLSIPQTLQDALFTGFRLKEGVDIGNLIKTYGEIPLEAVVDRSALSDFCRAGWVYTHQEGGSERWGLTDTGWPRLNGVLNHLLKPLSSPSDSQSLSSIQKPLSVTIL